MKTLYVKNHIQFMKAHSGINIVTNDGTIVPGYWCDFAPRTYPQCNDYLTLCRIIDEILKLKTINNESR